MAHVAGVARGTCADARRNSRPRDRAARAHAAQGGADADRGHASARERPGGATWREGGWQVEGPWVSGPWLVIWGGNTNALYHPSFSSLFLRVGLCSWVIF